MPAFNFYMERQKAGARNAQPGYIFASLQRDKSAPFEQASNDEQQKAVQKNHFIQNHINIAAELALSKFGKTLNAGQREEMRRHASEHSSPQEMLSAVLNDAEALATGFKDGFQQMLADAKIDEATYHALLSKFGASVGSLASLKALAEKWRNAQAAGVSFADFVAGNSRPTSQEFRGDIANLNISNYATDGKQFIAAGMTLDTVQQVYSHRLADGQRFTGDNLLNAGRGAKDLDFSPNDKRVVKNLAILDHYDPAGLPKRIEQLM
ncbi:MAG: hypothetical protein K2Q32_00795 [Alphaproteobacteria bacterium]|nr:hypothetical protein [Alphaproteobacteria bacterium]